MNRKTRKRPEASATGLSSLLRYVSYVPSRACVKIFSPMPVESNE